MPASTTTHSITQTRDGRAFGEAFDPVDEAQAESSSQSLSIASEPQNQQELRSSQHGITHALTAQNSATSLVDRVSSTVHTDSPPIPAGDQLATPAAHYPPMPSDPVSNFQPAGVVAIPATARAWGDSVNDSSAENVSGVGEAGGHVQRLIDRNAKTVLIFNGVFISTITSFIINSYKFLSPDIGHQISQRPSPPAATSILIVIVMWLVSLVLNVISTVFATSTLLVTLQWTRRYPQLPQVRRDRMHIRPYLFFSILSVSLFLAGLVVFFFIINKIVGFVVLIVLIAVGLIEVVYLVLRPFSTAPTLGGRDGAAGRYVV